MHTSWGMFVKILFCLIMLCWYPSPVSAAPSAPDFSIDSSHTNSVSGDTVMMPAGTIADTAVALTVFSASDTLGMSGESMLRLQPVIPENPRPEKKFWIFDRKPLAIGATLAFSIPIVMLEYQWWWGEEELYPQHKFIYLNDGWFNNYSLGVDKMGHFFTSYVYFHTFFDLMKWADYSDNTAFWAALAVPAAHAISIEMMDGFAKYGFSSYDLTANFLGMAYAYAQIKVPYLQNFNFKWSYYPTSAYDRPDKDWGLSHDYSGHAYWMSVNMKNVLPEGVARYWPRYLNLAVGYGASNVSYGDPASRAKQKLSVSLDYNLSAISIANDTWAMVVRLADKFHYPAPGIQFISGEKTKTRAFLLN